jgi:hypothetical protein
MLTLKKKPCTLGLICNSLERVGDDDQQTLFTIPVNQLLDPDELDKWLGKGFHDQLFLKDGRIWKPRNPEIESYALRHTLEDASVTLHMDKLDMEYSGVRLKALSIEPLEGGQCQLYYRLQIHPKNQHLTRLFDAQNCPIKISVDDAKIIDEKAKAAQGKLALETAKKNGGDEAAAAAH